MSAQVCQSLVHTLDPEVEPVGLAGRLRKAAVIGRDNVGLLSAPEWYPVATLLMGTSGCCSPP